MLLPYINILICSHPPVPGMQVFDKALEGGGAKVCVGQCDMHDL
jgi:hypothetical protein